jgi:hypothetical protein
MSKKLSNAMLLSSRSKFQKLKLLNLFEKKQINLTDFLSNVFENHTLKKLKLIFINSSPSDREIVLSYLILIISSHSYYSIG